MRRLLVASGNAGKVREIAQLLEGRAFEVVGLQDYPDLAELPEPHETFAENAASKALAAADHAGCWALADDSGLQVPALNDRPGVYSSRYAPTDEQRVARLLRELEGLQGDERRARFVCVVALAGPGRLLGQWEGVCEGVIATRSRGVGGFGYDPVFEVGGRTFAEMSAHEKNQISHRGRALRAFLESLSELPDEQS